MNLLNDLFQNSLTKNELSLSFIAINESHQNIPSSIYFPIRGQSTTTFSIINSSSQNINQSSMISIFDQKINLYQQQNHDYKKYIIKYTKIDKIISILSNKIKKIYYEFFIRMQQSNKSKSGNKEKSKQAIKQEIMQLNKKEINQFLAIKLTKLIYEKQINYKVQVFQRIKTKYRKQLQIQYYMFKISIFLLKKMEQIKIDAFAQIKTIKFYHFQPKIKQQERKQTNIKIRPPCVNIQKNYNKNMPLIIKQEFPMHSQFSNEVLVYRNIPNFPQRLELTQQDLNPNVQFLIQSQSDFNLLFLSPSSNLMNKNLFSNSMPPSPPRAHRSNQASQRTLKKQISDEQHNFNMISTSIKRRISDLTSMTGYCSKQDQKELFSQKLHFSKSDNCKEDELPTFFQFDEFQESGKDVNRIFKRKMENQINNQQINQNQNTSHKQSPFQSITTPYFIPFIPHSKNIIKNHIEIENLVAYKKSIEARKSITIKEINKNKQALKQIVGDLRKSKQKQKVIEKGSKNTIILKKCQRSERQFQKKSSLKNSLYSSPSETKDKLSLSKKNTPQKMNKSRSKKGSSEKKEVGNEANYYNFESKYNQTDESNSYNAQLYYKYLKLKNKDNFKEKGKSIQTSQKNKTKSSYPQEIISKKQTPNKTIIKLSKHPLKFKKIDLKIQLKNKQSNIKKGESKVQK